MRYFLVDLRFEARSQGPGVLIKELCHEGFKGVWHRAFSLLIFNEAANWLTPGSGPAGPSGLVADLLVPIVLRHSGTGMKKPWETGDGSDA